MSLEMKVGPAQLATHQGHAVLLTEPDGEINWPSEKGLYFYDTRVISSWTVYANGEPWDLLNGGTTTSFVARVFLTNRNLVTETGPIAPHTLGLVITRHIGGGVHEDLDLANYGRAVWPHDNGLIAVGFKRYGYADEAGRIAHDVSEAGSFFMLNQLPELYAGLHHDTANFPVQYLGAHVPLAWAAGSVFSMLQAILGFQPDAPRRMLYIDPVLPLWLRDLTLRDLRVGDQVFDIRFWRSDEETRFDVLKGDPASVARREVVVWSTLLKRGADELAAQ